MNERMGWECPKCGRVMAPFVTECPNCSKSASVWKGNISVPTTKLDENTFTVQPVLKDTITAPLNGKINLTCKDGALSKSECKSDKEDKFNESKIKVQKLNDKGKVVEVKDMTKEELKNLDNILEKILGNLL